MSEKDDECLHCVVGEALTKFYNEHPEHKIDLAEISHGLGMVMRDFVKHYVEKFGEEELGAMVPSIIVGFMNSVSSGHLQVRAGLGVLGEEFDDDETPTSH